MSNTTKESWSELASPLLALQEINKKAAEEMIRESISFYSDTFNTSTKYFQTMPLLRTSEDFANTNSKILTQQCEKFLEYSKNSFEIAQETVKEQLQWLTDNLNSAVKNATAVSKKATVCSS